MDLFTLFFGTSKKRMHPIMTDSLEKCERYKDQREATRGSRAGRGWHDFKPAAPGSDTWRQKPATVGGHKDDGGRSGYINKRGFNPHT